MKKYLIFLVLISLTINFYGQGQGARKFRQITEINDVPKEVKKNFNLRYPQSFVKMWYVTNIAYWYQDYSNTYYQGWYQPRTTVVYSFSEPSNYEVEFMRNDENSRAIFNRYGQWFETRSQIFNLPDEILIAIKDSPFANWIISDYKERIEIPAMIGSVYRIHVSKNHLSHIIRINDDGNIVQIKTE